MLTLLNLNPIQSLTSLENEILDYEPLHDIKVTNILPEIIHVPPLLLHTESKHVLDTIFPKGKKNQLGISLISSNQSTATMTSS